MPTRKAEAEWKGNLAAGSGRLKVGSGAFDGPYSFKSRFEEGQSATNPEDLIGLDPPCGRRADLLFSAQETSSSIYDEGKRPTSEILRAWLQCWL